MQCGFDGEQWTDDDAVTVLAALPDRWRAAVSGLSNDQLNMRPIGDMWSIGEYIDHVREVLFGMRFLLDIALTHPGTDLGPPPEPQFDPVARVVDIDLVLAGVAHEAGALSAGLTGLAPAAWASEVILDGQAVNAHWIARHGVHDATHHLMDVEGLRERL